MPDINLLLPPEIYAVPGFEINIYFRNIVTVIDFSRFAFDVECRFGRCDTERWRWIPGDQDTGRHPIEISVWDDDNGMIAKAATTIVVSPRCAGEGKTLNLLMIGASLTAASGHMEQLYARFQRPGNPKLNMLGQLAPGYGKKVPGGPAHEGYAGWNWHTFFQKTSSSDLDNDGQHPARPWDVRSPFLFRKGEQDCFDFRQYLDTVCQAEPDVICFELGVNGAFLARTDEEFEQFWGTNIFPYMKKMLTLIRQTLPRVRFGLVIVPAGAWDQDCCGEQFGCAQTRRRWLRNAAIMNRRFFQYADELQYKIVPEHVNIDGFAGYPTREEPVFFNSSKRVRRYIDTLHPNQEGYSQIADSEYFFLKHLLTLDQEEPFLH